GVLFVCLSLVVCIMQNTRKHTKAIYIAILVIYSAQGIGIKDLLFPAVEAAVTEGVDVRLTNQDQPVPYIDYYIVSEENPYILECNPGAEIVNGTIITWMMKGFREVYKWESATGKVFIDDFLVKGVQAPDEESTKPYNIVFHNPTPAMIGIYACQVYLPGSYIKEKEFLLNMYALPSSATEHIFHARVEDCMIYWSYATPPMYPKPNITCGYWNQSAETFDQVIQGGMLYRQFSNLTWAASMAETAIKINVVPHGLSLRCENNIAVANYSQVFELDHRDPTSEEAYQALQARGCPRFTATEHMTLDQTHCHPNCRDECQPPEGDVTHVQMFCPVSWKVYHWSNDTFSYPWQLSATCEHGNHIWTSADKGDPIVDTYVPFCVPWNTGGSKGISGEAILIFLILLLSMVLINFNFVKFHL
ncbi:unnamed protein product, partial [Meganyctiphanes norvegica]